MSKSFKKMKTAVKDELDAEVYQKEVNSVFKKQKKNSLRSEPNDDVLNKPNKKKYKTSTTTCTDENEDQANTNETKFEDDEFSPSVMQDFVEFQVDDDNSDYDQEQLLNYELPQERSDVIVNESLISTNDLHILVPRLGTLNKREKEIIKQNNLTVTNGRFRKIENAFLKRNWDFYLKDYIIPNPLLLFGYFSKESEDNVHLKRFYRNFAKDSKLFLRLANGLNQRTLFQVYCRARVLFSGLKKSSDFTDKDRKTITFLYKTYGDRYSSYCENYGYNPKFVREFIRSQLKPNGNQIKKGPWSPEELDKLKANVERIMKENNLTTFDGIPWTIVAQDMNRSDIQCRQRFFTKVMFRIIPSNTDVNLWDEKFDLAKVVALIKKCNFPDEAMIDWDFIKEQFPIDCFNILSRTWRVARMNVPAEYHVHFSELVDYLYQLRVLKPFSKDEDKMKEINDFVDGCF